MEGIVYLLAIIAVGVILFWAKRNDTAATPEETTGLLAMRPAPDRAAASRQPSRRGGVGR